MLRSDRWLSRWCLGVLAALLVVSGCASRKYVRDQVGALNPAVQEASNGVRENAERIDAVDRRAQQGIGAAQAADQKATQATQAAQTAQQAAQAADRKADSANQGVEQASNRITTVENRLSALNDNYTVSDTQSVMFAFGSSTLSSQARDTLDRIASDVATQSTGYLIELQGFTDSIGSENFNIGLSNRRSENVQRYLVSKNVPLYRISIVGLGESNPVGNNRTSAGRSQNRRVEVKVLKAAGR